MHRSVLLVAVGVSIVAASSSEAVPPVHSAAPATRRSSVRPSALQRRRPARAHLLAQWAEPPASPVGAPPVAGFDPESPSGAPAPELTLPVRAPAAEPGPASPAPAPAAAAVAPASGEPPPEILFTFDDGPSLERTPRVLEVLEQHHIHAVFFVNGMRFQGDSPTAQKARELLREVVGRGHAVGNHTIHHYFLCGTVYSRRVEHEVEGNARLIEQAIGQRPELFRTPYGAHCAALNARLARLGVTPIGWDIDPQDWRLQNTARVRDYVIRHLARHKSGRQILLLHDIHQCTVNALPQVLDWLDKENAARIERGEAPIRVVDYAYLLPPRPQAPSVPPILDGIGRVLLRTVPLPDPAQLWALLTGRPLRS